jgi:hypothetical protein
LPELRPLEIESGIVVMTCRLQISRAVVAIAVSFGNTVALQVLNRAVFQ